jgi:hypothetical protein
MYKTVFESIVNALKALQIKKPPQKTPPPTETTKEGPHTDGIEHIDGDNRHLDSKIDGGTEDPHQDHTDGIEHLDGDNRHLDGD